MRYATQAALSYATAEHAKYGYPGPEEFAARLKVRIVPGVENRASHGPPSFITQTPDTYAPRQRFTIFHELSHILMQRCGLEDDIAAEVDADDAELHLELVANHMAGLFLIPDPVVRHYIRVLDLTPAAVLAIQAAARASFAATIRRVVSAEGVDPCTIFLTGGSYVLDLASSDPYNRLSRYDRLPDPLARYPEAHLLCPPSRQGTIGVVIAP
ncbi:hypothetical protein DAETH_48530 (plasmid) [Deinococcus aetherius]|uniref:IrrE N-terminal-like domain-containing protein n=1 Tax=Deinococcus aetherius TaxID=200252 RepID=A0ABM8AM15_9DEIO|nr:ImmA/IrrE family metallo-endopeptidase [Deinococcus aetherius]BDP44884.1 hypothetical protein DAETH_48530 [Deinococcus aetherius]